MVNSFRYIVNLFSYNNIPCFYGLVMNMSLMKKRIIQMMKTATLVILNKIIENLKISYII